MEPHYECRLCHNQGEANGMFNHLLGRGHREKYFESRHDVDLTKITPSELQSRADKWRENDKIDSSIDTIYSDEMYPWPSGKAPWSLEQGGTGNPPTYARDFRRAKNANSLIIKPDPDRRAAETDAPKAIFHVKGLPMLHDAKALEAMYDAMKNLLDQASSFHERHVEDETARADVSTLQKLISSNIEVLSGIKLQEGMYYNTPNPMGEAMKSIKKSRSRSPSPAHNRERNRNNHSSRSQSSSRSPRSRSPARSPKRSRSPGGYSHRDSRRFKQERRSRSRSRSPNWRRHQRY